MSATGALTPAEAVRGALDGDKAHNTSTPEPAATDAEGVGLMLSVSARTVFRLESAGKIGPRSFRIGGSRRWAVSQIRDWVQAGCPNRATWLKKAKS